MNTPAARRFATSIRTILAVAALLTCAHMSGATEPVCTKGKPTITTAPDGSTVIRTHKVCVVSEK